MRVQTLSDEHLGPLSDFLARHADSSMYLRSNLQRDGLGGAEGARQATYVGALEGDQVVGVIAHYWTGVLIPQAPTGMLEPLARLVVGASGRPVTGVVGPAEQVALVRHTLGLGDVYARLDSVELLYSASIEELVVPTIERGGALTLHPLAELGDEPVRSWYRAYEIETLGASPGAELESTVRARLRRNRKDDSARIACHHGEPVCVVGFSARLPDAVQVGGAYTPPEHRGNRYAQAAAAALLGEARAQGVTRATLFIREDNDVARHTYEAVGFECVGRFQLVLFT